MDKLQKAAFGTIPTYLKACAELQITPAAVPTAKPGPEAAGTKKGKLAALQGGLSAGRG